MQIIVLGMHRSGTSAAARLVNLMGASLGPVDLIGRPASDNAKGFWERQDIRDLNDALLASCGASWDNPWPYSPDAVPAEDRAGLEGRIAETIFALDAARPWVMKDPRLCLTFSHWRATLEAPICVFALRHPDEVAQSLYARNAIPRPLGLALWEHYLSRALQQTRGLPTIWLDFARLVADPVQAVTQLHRDLSTLGATGLRLPSTREIKAFVDPELRHHSVATERVADPAGERYQALLAADDESRDGRWTVSAASSELLAWHSAQREMAARLNARLEASERESAELAVQVVAQRDAGTSTLLAGQREAEVSLQLAAQREAALSAQLEAMRATAEHEASLRSSLGQAQQQELQLAASRVQQLESTIVELRRELSDARRDAQIGLSHAQAEAERGAQEIASRIRERDAEIRERDAEISAQEKRLRELQEGLREQTSQAVAWRESQQALQTRLESLTFELGGLRQLQVDLSKADDVRAQLDAEKRHSALSVLAGAHSQSVAETQQLARWLDEALGLMRASFGSARWRLGDRMVRAIEMLMLRRRPRLAPEFIGQIERNFRAWREGRTDNRHLVEHFHAQLWNDSLGVAWRELRALPTALPDALPGALPRGFGLHVPAKTDPAVRDVICFPVIDWHFRVQRPQHVARVLGSRGHRVFYLGTQPETGCTSNGFEVLESPEQNVWLVRLKVTCSKVPNLYQARLDGAAWRDYCDALDAMRDALGIVTPVAIVDLPFWRPLVEAMPGAVMIYDCMDHHAGFSTNTDAMLSEEEALLRAADAVVVTSAWLEDRLGKEREVALIRNGADIERFAGVPALPMVLSERPVVGYLGAISDWFDVEMVASAAREMPDVDFVLVGDVTHPDVRSLKSLSNVRFVGEVPYAQAPAFVHAFDVCTIPFLITDLTRATNPVKAYEYLAAGKPVVATAMPELAGMDGLVRIAADTRAFIEHLRTALAGRDDREAQARRRAWAANHDWLLRGEAFERVVERQLPRASVVVLAWNNLDFTRACLASLERYTDYPDWELVLVDNASTDGTPDFFRAYAADRPHVRVVLNDANLGFAAGNNCGIRAASGDVIVLLNNDTYVTPGWLSALVGHLRRRPELGIVGPVTNNIGNEARIQVDYGDMAQMQTASRIWTREHPRALLRCNVVAFFCCAIPRAVIDEVGLLDEEFGQGFFEDDDYCNRIRATGREVAIADDVFVHHHLSASFNTLREQHRKELFERNKAIYERKWGPWTPHQYRIARK